MAERRRQRKRPESQAGIDKFDKPEKVEYEIAKYLRYHLPPKQTTLLGHKVDYFIASRAIDLLMNSKWAHADKRTDEVLFPSRDAATNFMNVMLMHRFFHRAKTIIVKKEIKKKIDTTTAAESTDDGNKSESKKSKNKEDNSKKEKKKVKLDMHMEQVFVDLNEPYVWIYDYIPMKTWLIGGGLVIAAIAICLFPLWPRTVRNYVYYLSIAVAVFLFFIIALALLKLVVFAIVWALTLGRHHLWILPNLTEDVGFFESFWPLYKHEYKGVNSSCSNKDKKKTEAQNKNENKSEQKNDHQDDEDENENYSTEDNDNDEEDDEDQDYDDPTSSNKQNKSKKKDKPKFERGFEILDSNECNEN